MALKLITAPAVEPISLVEAKAHLRVDHADDDDFISFLITAVRQQIDGKDGWLNRALITQTWDMYLDHFPGHGSGYAYGCGGEIKIPLPPLQSITSIKYDDSDGVEQTVSSDNYTVDTVSNSGWVVPNISTPWPIAQIGINKVRVRFVAGYGDAGSAVPATIRSWMLLNIGTLYAQRETVVDGRSLQPISLPDHILNMLSTFRVY